MAFKAFRPFFLQRDVLYFPLIIWLCLFFSDSCTYLYSKTNIDKTLTTIHLINIIVWQSKRKITEQWHWVKIRLALFKNRIIKYYSLFTLCTSPIVQYTKYRRSLLHHRSLPDNLILHQGWTVQGTWRPQGDAHRTEPMEKRLIPQRSQLSGGEHGEFRSCCSFISIFNQHQKKKNPQGSISFYLFLLGINT